MDVISNVNKDVIAGKSAEPIRLLLDIEADAAEGRSYTTRYVIRDDANRQGDTEKNGDELCLCIPYLGVIKIAHQDSISCELSGAHQMSLVESPQREPTLAVSNDAFASLSNALLMKE